MSGGWAHGVTMVVLGSCLCACSAAQLGDRQQEALERVHERARELVGDAVERGIEADEDQELIVFSMRYNPVAECGCPDWEIVFRGRWTRVFVEAASGAQPVLDELTELARRDLDAEVFAVYRAAGRLDGGETRVEETGLEYITFRIVRFMGDADRSEVDRGGVERAGS